MSLHKLTAGSGYDYLTRQVAALDATDKGHTGLASYYAAKGEAPGVWMGSGIEGIEGLSAGDVVTEQQMQSLFGSGHHPLAHERRERLPLGATTAEVREATRLGTPFKVYAGDAPAFGIEVARRLEAINAAADRPLAMPLPLAERARVRTEVAREYFKAEYGREPADAREVAATIAKHSRPKTTAVAGYDLTFSPVKSVSSLWAIAEPPVAAAVERAHLAAVRDALTFIEDHALFTRTGTGGVRQVDVRGLVAAAFTHRESRAGDPDLHTHVAVANKVQAHDGRWLSIDGRLLYKANVAASETYNAALERHLADELGLRFAPRQNTDLRKRPIREIVGVDPVLNERWSQRRAAIETRRAELAAQFQRDHHRPPTAVESIQLAQQATLETRQAKHEPRTLTEQRATWREQAIAVLGSEEAVDELIARTLNPQAIGRQRVTAAWIDDVANRVVAEVEQRRATWQTWHIRAEALRQVRDADLPTGRLDTVVGLVVDEALAAHSVRLAADPDPITEPATMRRRDGASVYHVAGSEMFTSTAVLAAEQRIVAAAGRTHGRAASETDVGIALAEAAANQHALNPGQSDLVRQMATSGARLQLAIAPAGAGKTTALRALAGAWHESGGTVLGLAPSAAAAAALAEQTGTHTDTLAKLLHDLHQPPAVDSSLADTLGPGTLLVIDEAGMADTLSLDAVIGAALERGASVRLIGDDQQLAAIGAGGVLRDIAATHGAVRLDELMRFADPAEAAASLALREGRLEALGHYLDRQRIHIGDLGLLSEQVFTAWNEDLADGLDSIMLAPTRELVCDLNVRARAERLAGRDEPSGPAIELADGNVASVGDLLITRRNDRRLRISATDWVKNNDRWHVTQVTPGGDLRVQHARSGHLVTLPVAYLAEHAELGYATTTHTAQGVSVDTMHGLVVGNESRQQLYTMMTRGRLANHLYLTTAGDGDPHLRIHPSAVHPPAATELLADILARDEAPRSATTLDREAADPRTQLTAAAERYLDALYGAAEEHIGPEKVHEIEQAAERLIRGIADEPAWPALRAHLLLIEADGHEAIARLETAVKSRGLDDAIDPAAVLDWRLDATGLRGQDPGPLPWMPAVPKALADDPAHGHYLAHRAQRVAQLAQTVRHEAASTKPAWLSQGTPRPSDRRIATVEVWRAANAVAPEDPRPTGPPRLQKAAADYQRRLDARLNAVRSAAVESWGPLIAEHQPHPDPYTAQLAEHLDLLGRAGHDVTATVRQAAAAGPLPDDHASAALWWRIHRIVPADVLRAVAHHEQSQPIPRPSTEEPATSTQVAPTTLENRTDIPQEGPGEPAASAAHGTDVLAVVAAARDVLPPVEPSEATSTGTMRRALALGLGPVTGLRILELSEQAAEYYEAQFADSWASSYLSDRVGQDLHCDPRFRPGYAPAGWTRLTDHLRSRGATDEELLAAGLAKTASTGHLIDLFRDRLVLPIIDRGNVLGFVARRNPNASDEKSGPKYLNTPTTVVFDKSAHLYGMAESHQVDAAIPVIVEGPLDAIAVTTATAGSHLGISPLGTALTEQHADAIATFDHYPILATDADTAGRVAAERAYWHLTTHQLDPRHAHFPGGTDPAGLLEEHGPTPLRAALHQARPLAHTLIDERCTHMETGLGQLSDLGAIGAAQPSGQWSATLDYAAARTVHDPHRLREALAQAAHRFDRDPRAFTAQQLQGHREIRRRLDTATTAPAEQRWRTLAASVDPRLPSQSDWRATAEAIDQLAAAGYDPALVVHGFARQAPLNERPAQDLRYRLEPNLPEAVSHPVATASDPIGPREPLSPPRAPTRTRTPRPRP